MILIISLQIRLRDYGVLDFDAADTRRQPPVDTTWQQVSDILSDFKIGYISFFLGLTQVDDISYSFLFLEFTIDDENLISFADIFLLEIWVL